MACLYAEMPLADGGASVPQPGDGQWWMWQKGFIYRPSANGVQSANGKRRRGRAACWSPQGRRAGAQDVHPRATGTACSPQGPGRGWQARLSYSWCQNPCRARPGSPMQPSPSRRFLFQVSYSRRNCKFEMKCMRDFCVKGGASGSRSLHVTEVLRDMSRLSRDELEPSAGARRALRVILPS